MIKFYFKIWKLMAINSISSWISKKEAFAIFVFGKVVRYLFYFGFLYFLVNKTNGLAGYTSYQTLFFTATYTLVDTLGQFLFRSVYTFRQLITSGDFDLILAKPVNPLFRSLVGGPDPMDLITIPPILGVVLYLGSFLDPSFISIIVYILLICNAILISMSIHIFVLSFGVITLEIDHTIMIFRDFSSMGRMPIDIYKEPLKSFLTFIVPIGLLFTVPAKALMGLISPVAIFLSIFFGFVLFISSLKFWQFALKKYTSASS